MSATRFYVLLIALTLYGASAFAATVEVKDFTSYIDVSLKGEIGPADENIIRGAIQRAKTGTHFSFHIKSEGGDVQAAMDIGRLLRSVNASVSTERCYSACVLIFIGGVDRVLFTNKPRGRGLGIHRLYYSSLDPNTTMAEISSRRHALTEQVKLYIESMNVSGQLFDLMEATPPEKMHVLSEEEIEALGLDQPDPVWDESVVAKEAQYYGTNSREFRRRRASLESLCPKPSTYVHATPEIMQAFINCEEAAKWNIPVREYTIRKSRYDAWVRSMRPEGAPQLKWSPAEKEIGAYCRNTLLVQGAATCGKP